MACPDPECQKIVDNEILIEKKRKDLALKIKLYESESRKRAAIRTRSNKTTLH